MRNARCCRTLPAPRGLLGCRGLAFHIDDLNAAVDFRERLARVLELGLAVADGDEVGAGNAELFDQIFLDRVGAPLRQILIVGFAACGVGMTCDYEGRTLQIGIGKRASQRLDRRQRLRADIG